jgi:hypothetical protein
MTGLLQRLVAKFLTEMIPGETFVVTEMAVAADMDVTPGHTYFWHRVLCDL